MRAYSHTHTLYSESSFLSFFSSSPTMASSILCSKEVVLATAMAVSGTVILLAFRLQKSVPVDQIPQSSSSSSQQALRSCITTEGKRRKKKKRVHFAKDVVDPRGNGEEFRRQHSTIITVANKDFSSPEYKNVVGDGGKIRGMPANRAALYNGILRDRVVHRLACSY